MGRKRNRFSLQVKEDRYLQVNKLISLDRNVLKLISLDRNVL